jgi:hypothetical protein
MPEFPHVFDSTIINDSRKCPYYFEEAYINSIRGPGENVDLMFGAAFAKGLEKARLAYYRDELSSDEAITIGLGAAARYWGDFQEPQGHPKQWESLMLALHGYFEQWPLNQPPYPYRAGMIEYSFSIPLDIKHPDTGREIVYAGKFDMLGTDGISTYPVDEKTTGRNFFNWAEGWNLWGQFIGYIWGCRQMGLDVRQLLVRGIYVSKNDIKYIQHFVPATEAVTQRWLDDLRLHIELLIEMYKHNRFPRVYGTACKVYKPCTYLPLCEATHRSDWISLYHQVEPWNPLARPGGEQ